MSNKQQFTFKDIWKYKDTHIIRVFSESNRIDYLKEITTANVYVDEKLKDSFNVETVIVQNNQPNTRSFEISIIANNMTIEVIAHSDYSAGDVKAMLVPPLK